MDVPRQVSTNVADVREDDVAVVTGVAGSGVRYEGLRGIVATVSRGPDRKVTHLKLWPLREENGGKVWFAVEDIEAIEIDLFDRD